LRFWLCDMPTSLIELSIREVFNDFVIGVFPARNGVGGGVSKEDDRGQQSIVAISSELKYSRTEQWP